jgi:hypothetical protein
MAQLDVTVNLTDGSGYDETFVTWDTWGGEFLADVPYGTYTYTLSKPCHETITGTVTVDCNNDQGVSVNEVLAPKTTNNVFFFIGSPMAQLDVTVNLTDGSGYDETFVTWDTWGGEFLADVPYGTYTYTLSKPCHETITGTVTVDCNNDQGVSVNEVLQLKDANTVQFNIGITPLLGAEVKLYDGAGYSETFVTSDVLGGEQLIGVPFGQYNYTISAPCYDTVVGIISIDCNNDMIIEIDENPTEIVLDLNVTQVGNLLTADAIGVSYQWIDCENNGTVIAGEINQNFQTQMSGEYAVIITDGNCSDTSMCYTINTAGIGENEINEFKLYPNPAINFVRLESSVVFKDATIEVVGLDGKILYRIDNINTTQYEISIIDFPRGYYFINVIEGGLKQTKKFVKL